MTTIDDVKFFRLKTISETDGSLVPIESNIDIPFPIKRIFYVFGVNHQDNRGKHSHFKTKQILICLSGEIEVICDDGTTKKSYILNDPSQALYIPELIWDEQIYQNPESILLVIANTKYDIKDYIEDYEEFKAYK